MFAPFESILHAFEMLVLGLMLVGGVSLFGGIALAAGLRLGELRWTWAAVICVPASLLCLPSLFLGLAACGACLVGCLAGMAWQSSDLAAGGDHAETARGRLGVFAAAHLLMSRWQEQREGHGWMWGGWLTVGRGKLGRRVSIRAGGVSGAHTLIVGATGSGKTCGEAWIVGRLIEDGCGAVAIDPKGDDTLRQEMEASARRAGVPFLEWRPEGPLAYNPYAHGGDDELAEKALAGETFTEPHYLRQAQLYLAHAVRVIRAAGTPVTVGSLAAHMDPLQLEMAARGLPPEQGERAQGYLDSLTERQKRELAGVRDRLSILAESEVAPWLEPERADGAIELADAINGEAVVYFALEADRRPLLAKMLGGAIVSDLVMLAAHRRPEPVSTVVVIDEFSAVGAEHVWRLFARARAAGISLVLATQELADLRSLGQGALRDQVLGNLEAVIAYRQNVPASAELISAIAGEEAAWITSQQTGGRGIGGRRIGGALLAHRPSGYGQRRRGYEPAIHPTRIQRLATGQAVVIAPTSGQRPAVARMCHPSETR
jgi:conjugal transfer pilus assembly protein TraD